MYKPGMCAAEIRQFCNLDAAGKSLLWVVIGQMKVSARGYHRVDGGDPAVARSGAWRVAGTSWPGIRPTR